MSYQVVKLMKNKKPVFMILQNESELEVRPSKFLKHLSQCNLSFNTVKSHAFSLVYYYEYLAEEQLTIEGVIELPYLEQNDHFIKFLYWLKDGHHTKKCNDVQNSTCNKYLRCVFSYYEFLSLQDNVSSLSIFQGKLTSYVDVVGNKHAQVHNRYRGYFKVEEPCITEITKEEIKLLLDACVNDRDKLLLLLMAETGFRLGEILGLYYDQDIDFENKTIRVTYRDKNENMARAKNAEQRIARLSDDTFFFLTAYITSQSSFLSSSHHLFTKRSGPNKGMAMNADDVYSLFKRLKKKTQIKSHPHQLRHFFAEQRRSAGWDLNEIRFALGHKMIETTVEYLGENNEKLIQETDAFYENNKTLYSIDEFL